MNIFGLLLSPLCLCQQQHRATENVNAELLQPLSCERMKKEAAPTRKNPSALLIQKYEKNFNLGPKGLWAKIWLRGPNHCWGPGNSIDTHFVGFCEKIANF